MPKKTNPEREAKKNILSNFNAKYLLGSYSPAFHVELKLMLVGSVRLN